MAVNEQETAVSKTTVSETTVFSTKTLLENVTQPLLIAIKVSMILLAIITAMQMATPATRWMPLVVLGFFATLAGIYSTRWLAQFEQMAVSRTYYRLAELAVIAIIIRLFTWVVEGNGWPTLAQFQDYLRAPIPFFTGPLFLISLLIVAFAWQRGIAFSNLFIKLAISPAEEKFYSQRGVHQSSDAPIMPVRSQLVASFFSQWIWGGVLLLIGVGLSTFQLGEVTARLNLFSVARQSLRPSLIMAMLAYFLVGFWLLSQARLMALNGRWLIEGVQPSEKIAKSWSRHSQRLLLLLAFLAAFIPIGSTVPASRILSVILGSIIYIINFIFFIFSFLFFGLFSLLFSGLDGGGTEAQEPPPPPSFEELLPPQEPTEPNEMLAMLASSLLWTLIIFGVVAAVLFVMRDRGEWINGRFFQKLWQTFKKWLAELRHGVNEQLALVQQALQSQRQEDDSPTAPSKPPWRFIRLNSLSPRDQIRYFYLSTVKRAGQKGVNRVESNTPLEYSKQLKTHWPDAEEELNQLTEAFLHARYSPKPVETEEVHPIKRQWQQVKRNLRRRKA
ncbi:MAG: DUF4129 domain-containing protein [Chloroflexota bacterium]